MKLLVHQDNIQFWCNIKTSFTWHRVLFVTCSSLFSTCPAIGLFDSLTGVTCWTGKGILRSWSENCRLKHYSVCVQGYHNHLQTTLLVFTSCSLLLSLCNYTNIRITLFARCITDVAQNVTVYIISLHCYCRILKWCQINMEVGVMSWFIMPGGGNAFRQ